MKELESEPQEIFTAPQRWSERAKLKFKQIQLLKKKWIGVFLFLETLNSIKIVKTKLKSFSYALSNCAISIWSNLAGWSLSIWLVLYLSNNFLSRVKYKNN